MLVCSCCGRQVTDGEVNRTVRSIRKHVGDMRDGPHIRRFTPMLCTICTRRYLLSLSATTESTACAEPEPSQSSLSQSVA
jgi:hypothetical protein